MRSLRFFVPALAALTLGACSKDSTPTDDEATAVMLGAVQESSSTGDSASLGALAFPTSDGKADDSSGGGTAKTAEERLAQLQEYVKANLKCVTVGPAVGKVNLTFGQSCTWSGRKWTGTVTITYTKVNEALIEFEGLSVNGKATMSGSWTVTQLAVGHITVKGGRTAVWGTTTVTGSIDAEYQWTDTTITVINATHTRTVAGATATLQTTSLVWQKADIAPESGSITFTSKAGKTWTVSFSRDAATGDILATLTGPGGKTVTKDVNELI